MNVKAKFSKREFLLLAGCVLLLGFHAIRGSVIGPLERKRHDLKTDLAKISAGMNNFKRSIALAAADKRFLEDERKEWFDGAESNKEPAAVRMQEFARQAGSKLVSIRPGDIIRQAGFEQQSVKIVLESDINALISFINLLLGSPYYNVKDLEIDKERDGKLIRSLLTVEKFVLL